ncbi:MAG: response regulator [Elusimicrobiota bacterium]
MAKTRVLIVDDDKDLVKVLSYAFKNKKYDVSNAYNGEEALEKVSEFMPDLIILDVIMPRMNGFDVCSALRESGSTSLIPIIMLTIDDMHADKIKALEKGADEYITKPFDLDELIARAEGLLARTKKQLLASPLTLLPGSIMVEEAIRRKISKREKFAAAYLDLDNFKIYNDCYGYGEGDVIIRFTAKIIVDVIKNFGNEQDVVGHIGGDDFIFLTSPDKIDRIGSEIIKRFDMTIKNHYHAEDLKKGHILAMNRQGEEEKFPIMTISIGALTNENRHIHHYAQVVQILAEVKKYAKQHEGVSFYFKDRRKK